MSPRASRTATALATPLLLVALQGCSTPMNSYAATPARYPPPGHFEDVNRRAGDGPLRFWQHNFGVYCFDTWGCTVRYGAEVVVEQPKDELRPSIASLPGNVLKRMNGTIGPYRNFQGPLFLDWLDKSRNPLHLRLDLDQIFADGLIRHAVAQAEIRADATVLNPDIVVQIEDRTVRLFMRALIPLKRPAIPGNRLSDSIDENVLVHEVKL